MLQPGLCPGVTVEGEDHLQRRAHRLGRVPFEKFVETSFYELDEHLVERLAFILRAPSDALPGVLTCDGSQAVWSSFALLEREVDRGPNDIVRPGRHRIR